VRESVRPENLVNTISQKQMKGISPNFGHRCN